MRRFLDKHAEKTLGELSCFDRVRFKGYLPLTWPKAMEGFMARLGLRIKDFKPFVREHSERVVEHAKAFAQQAGRPYIYLKRFTDKEDLAKEVARRDGIEQGLVCVLGAIEGCRSFRVAYGEGRPRLAGDDRKGLSLYYYFLDRDLGLVHVRLQSWFPFTVQVCFNGHEWLARKLDRHRIAYRREDNAFLWIEDPRRAQRLADQLVKRKWPGILAAFARTVNPLMRSLLRGLSYHWVLDQAEYATDIPFRGPQSLRPLYERLLRHALVCFGAEEVMTFLGRRLHAGFAGEIINHGTKRWPGARVKHGMKHNWIKMYDKHGSVLRIETVINDPYEFKVWRRGKRKGQHLMGWFPMAKGVANFRRYAEVARAANARYLDALAVVDDPAPAQQSLRALAQPVRTRGRTSRGFNPASEDDARLFAAVLRGEHAIRGFRNADIRRQLFPPAHTPAEARRQAARTWRLLRRLHVRRLIAKIPRSRRWRVTAKGHILLTTMLRFHHQDYLEALLRDAA